MTKKFWSLVFATVLVANPTPVVAEPTWQPGTGTVTKTGDQHFYLDDEFFWGAKTTATTVVSEKNGWLKMAAYGFTFSKKTIKVKITKKIK